MLVMIQKSLITKVCCKTVTIGGANGGHTAPSYVIGFYKRGGHKSPHSFILSSFIHHSFILDGRSTLETVIVGGQLEVNI